MRIDLKNLIKKPAVLSVFAFLLIFTVVAVSAFAVNRTTPSDTASQTNITKSGYGLYIDGKYIAACEAESAVKTALSSVLSYRVSGYDDVSVKNKNFTNLIDVVAGEYDENSFVSGEALLALLGIESDNSFTTKVSSFDGKDSVSLNVRVTAENVVTTVLESETVYVDNANLLATHDDIVVNEGQNGITEDVYEYVYVNGECISKKFLSSTVTVEAVDRVVERGVLDNVRISASSEDTAVDDSPFIMPYDGGYISSYYGWRSMGWHSGIDIIGGLGVPCYGDPVWASRDGVVTFAESSGTYGLVVIISHEDGSETRYAHLSAIKVTVGEMVEQGQVIGNIGTTGFVTGAHLHFEIRIDGETVDPLQFVRLYK